MVDDWHQWVLEQSGARGILEAQPLQELWRGYGELLRLRLEGGHAERLILKRVSPPGPSSSVDRRKLRSYEIEQSFYLSLAADLEGCCRLARCYGATSLGEDRLLLLEDLIAAGYRPSWQPKPEQAKAGLRWLAQFHARFLHQRPAELWNQGCYWRLELRRDEFNQMPDGILKELAEPLDERLSSARFQTLLHGDAKIANFCWNENASAAAVDFQWVGPGCGIRDVALFLDRGIGRRLLASEGQEWLDLYFHYLRQALTEEGHQPDVEALVAEWNSLFSIAWTDYSRFCLGWAGDSYQLDTYSRKQLELAKTKLIC